MIIKIEERLDELAIYVPWAFEILEWIVHFFVKGGKVKEINKIVALRESPQGYLPTV
jgi:hypothetical protein